MMKKAVKVFLIVLMAIGVFVAVSNVLETDLTAQAAGKWVKYLPDLPDCKGAGTTCYDMTAPPTED